MDSTATQQEAAFFTVEEAAATLVRDTARVDETEAIKAGAARRYWGALLVWYALAAAVSILNGLFAASPWWVCVALVGGLELVTFFAAMVEDDWANDFRGDRQIFVRGTVANVLVAFALTGVGVGLSG